MNKIRTAVVGVGKMGAIHAKVYAKLAQSDLVAVVDVDKDKIALMGISMGGYLAARAAAFDTRIKACVVNGGIFDLGLYHTQGFEGKFITGFHCRRQIFINLFLKFHLKSQTFSKG